MASDIRIRPATNADRAAIRGLVEVCLAEFGLCSNYDSSDKDLLDLDASYALSGGAFLVAEDLDGTIVGTVGIAAMGPKQMKLRKMYVASDQRGRGLGRRLFDSALREARERGCATIFLETMNSMSAAIAMYEAAGFSQVPGAIQSPRCQRLYRLDLDV